jgi:hypothetical protein
MSVAACPLCGQRKGKRHCPAKGTLICSVCCGTKRQVEIQCPLDCTYLTGAHAPSWDGRESDRRLDMIRIAPHIERLGQDEAAVFFYLLAGMVRISSKHQDADDVRWQQAVTALRKTLETKESGLVYEHAAEGFRSQELVREMREVLQPPEAKQPVAPDRTLLAALSALGGALADTIKEGGDPRAFLSTAVRLTARLVEHGGDKPAGPAAKSSLIEP